MDALLYGVAVALYLFCAAGGLRTGGALGVSSVDDGAGATSRGRFERWRDQGLVLIALILHGVLLHEHVFSPQGLRFGFSYAWSTLTWLAALMYWAESWRRPLAAIQIMVLPAAAVGVTLPWLFPGVPRLTEATWALRWHLMSAMLAYSLLTLALLHAVLMLMVERRLHQTPRALLADERDVRGINRLLAQLPPLLVLDRMLFRLIGLGFLLLSATVVSGVGFSEKVFGTPLRWDHKTLFTLMSWAVFGGLLMGRWRYGWRGRTAVQWFFWGFTFLLLAYVGSRFVLEIVLGRA